MPNNEGLPLETPATIDLTETVDSVPIPKVQPDWLGDLQSGKRRPDHVVKPRGRLYPGFGVGVRAGDQVNQFVPNTGAPVPATTAAPAPALPPGAGVDPNKAAYDPYSGKILPTSEDAILEGTPNEGTGLPVGAQIPPTFTATPPGPQLSTAVNTGETEAAETGGKSAKSGKSTASSAKTETSEGDKAPETSEGDGK
jgi:hypothetical protein